MLEISIQNQQTGNDENGNQATEICVQVAREQKF